VIHCLTDLNNIDITVVELTSSAK